MTNSILDSDLKSCLKSKGGVESASKKLTFSLDKKLNLNSSGKKLNISGIKRRQSMMISNNSAVFAPSKEERKSSSRMRTRQQTSMNNKSMEYGQTPNPQRGQSEHKQDYIRHIFQ